MIFLGQFFTPFHVAGMIIIISIYVIIREKDKTRKKVEDGTSDDAIVNANDDAGRSVNEKDD